MRLHHSPDGAAHDIFMTFAPGTHTNHPSPPPPQEPDAYTDPLDDVFGSASPSPSPDPAQGNAVEQTRRDVTDPSDIPRLRSVHVTNGYREGLSASKEEHVQAGFDEGYSLGAELGMKVGWVLGALDGVLRAGSLEKAGERQRDEDGGEKDGEGLLNRDMLRKELVRAEEELSIKKLFGEEFFGGDGVWTYAVAGAEREGEESMTFEEVSAAHPLVVNWERRVRELAERVGLNVA